MQFKNLIAATLVSVAAAQDPSSLAAFESAAASYIQSLIQDPTFIQQVAPLATASPQLLQSLQALATASVNPAALTAPPALFSALPSPVNQVFESVYTHEIGLASQYGLLSGGSVAGTATTSAAAVGTGSSSSGAGTGSNTTVTTAAVSTSTAAGTGGSTTSSGSSSGSSSSVSHGMAAPTGVAMMGMAAAVVGGIAALL